MFFLDIGEVPDVLSLNNFESKQQNNLNMKDTFSKQFKRKKKEKNKMSKTGECLY